VSGRIFIFCAAVAAVASYLAACSSEDGVVPIESPHWLLNGNPSPQSTSIPDLRESVIPSLIDLPSGYYGCDTNGTWEVDTVGLWNGRTVVDLFMTLSCLMVPDSSKRFSYRAVKGIAVNVSGSRYRLVHLRSYDPGSGWFEPSSIKTVGGDQVLCTFAALSGTGGYRDEAYWAWDEQLGMPRDLQYRSAVALSADFLIPTDHSWHKGGHWNLDSLLFESYLKRPGDGNCCPTGGKFRAELGLSKGRLFVRKATFDFADRAQWWPTPPDSDYVKQPRRIYSGELTSDVSEDPDWLYYNHKDQKYQSAPDATTLDTLVNWHLRNAVGFWSYERSVAEPFTLHMDTIGSFGELEVVQMNYDLDCPQCRYPYVSAVAVEVHPKKYRLVYVDLVANADSANSKATILNLGSTTVLAVQGNSKLTDYYGGDYWIWPLASRVPINLYQQWVSREAVRLILQKEFGGIDSVRRKNDRWDFRSFRYESNIRRQADPTSPPIEATLTIQFGLRNERLVPIGYELKDVDTASSPN
jgi:hypothetical protein